MPSSAIAVPTPHSTFTGVQFGNRADAVSPELFNSGISGERSWQPVGVSPLCVCQHDASDANDEARRAERGQRSARPSRFRPVRSRRHHQQYRRRQRSTEAAAPSRRLGTARLGAQPALVCGRAT
jgi:hypothetical protein